MTHEQSHQDTNTGRQSEGGIRIQSLKQGETIQADQLIEGNKIFADATWKANQGSGSQGSLSAVLGVYCQIQQQCTEEKILIQASASMTSSALQAETLAFSSSG
jgi:hypothetical protein